MKTLFARLLGPLALGAFTFLMAAAAVQLAQRQGWLPGHITADRIDAAWPGGLHLVAETPRAAAVPLRRVVHTPTAGPAQPVGDGGLQTALLVAGVASPVAEGPVALPSGSRFQVQMRSSEPLRVTLHAVNPEGRMSAQPLWQGIVFGDAVTPTLRLQGTRGMETLRLVTRPMGRGSMAVQDMRILHL